MSKNFQSSQFKIEDAVDSIIVSRQNELEEIVNNWCSTSYKDSIFPPCLAISVAFFCETSEADSLHCKDRQLALQLHQELFEKIDNITISSTLVAEVVEYLLNNIKILPPTKTVTILKSLVGHKVDTFLIEKLNRLGSDIRTWNIKDVERILDVARTVSKQLHCNWVDTANQQEEKTVLTNKLIYNTPFALPIKYQESYGQQTALANIANLVLEDSKVDIKKLQVSHCHSVLSVIPRIEMVRCGITDFDGKDTIPIHPLFLSNREPTYATQQYSTDIAKAIARFFGASS